MKNNTYLFHVKHYRIEAVGSAVGSALAEQIGIVKYLELG